MHAVVFDLETTGLSPTTDEILEIGALVVRDGRVVRDERFQTLVRPTRPISVEVSLIHGIRDEHVAGAPPLAEALPAFLRFVDGRPLVAHNAGFDLSFLRAAGSRLGLPVPAGAHCTMVLSRRCFPRERRHNLASACARLGVLPSGAHRALADVEATAELFVRLSSITARAY